MTALVDQFDAAAIEIDRLSQAVEDGGLRRSPKLAEALERLEAISLDIRFPLRSPDLPLRV